MEAEGRPSGMGASDPVEAAYRLLVEETARVYAAAALYLRGVMGVAGTPRRTMREIARQFGYSERQCWRAVKVLRERIAGAGAGGGGLAPAA